MSKNKEQRTKNKEGTLPERRREYEIRALQRRYVDLSTEPLYFAQAKQNTSESHLT